MVEAGGKGAVEADVLKCIAFGHECCKKLIAGVEELVKLAGKKKWDWTAPCQERSDRQAGGSSDRL